jgi:hypothetical protein
VASASLHLPAVAGAAWEALAANVEVQERATLLLIARWKKEATRRLERGARDGALGCLNEAKKLLASAPPTPEMAREAAALAEIETYVESGERLKFLKQAKYQAYTRRKSKPYP